MSAATKIEWTDATFNPWWGCEPVSPGCAHCYAETLAHRYEPAGLWGAGHRFRFFGGAHWEQPLRWQRKAEREGRRIRVFCASMADVFEDRPELGPWRERLWTLIRQTPLLDWQLLTKRPEHVAAMVPWRNVWPENVWIGASVENARHTWRADVLREIPAAVRFVSAEPLLGPLVGVYHDSLATQPKTPLDLTGIDWLIVGGESGPGARPLKLEWVEELVAAARAAGAAPFVKQLGRWYGGRKGADIDSWPEHLRVREMPEAS